MRVLMIDDQSIEYLSSIIEDIEDANHECIFQSFINMEQSLLGDEYDVIILDYKAENENLGEDWFNFIWSTRLFPIIFHTAFPEEVSFELDKKGILNHPLISVIKKGLNSSEQIMVQLSESEKIIGIFSEYEKSFKTKFNQIKQDTKKYTLQFMPKNYFMKNLQKYEGIINRRLANAIRQNNLDIIEPFEMYIYPPVSDSLLTGDIIKKCGEEQYFVILSPSCDLVEGQSAVAKVHVAIIESSDKIFQSTGLISAKSVTKITDELPKRLLNSGYNNDTVALPPLVNGYSNSVAINLKNCIYIERDKIDINCDVREDTDQKSNNEYVRLASIDSPFSEMISWAYMSVACRPGLPVRNVTSWAANIFTEFNERHANDSNGSN